MNRAHVLGLSVQYATEGDAPQRGQCRRWVAAARAALRDTRPCHLTLRFVDASEQRGLNRTYRGRDYATNVLTFNFDVPKQVIADIVVCVPVALREARQQKKSTKGHFAHLVVHGTLHAYGYDHENPADAEAMEALESDVLRRFQVPNPYA